MPDDSRCQQGEEIQFAKENKDMTLQDTIYTDETTVQIKST